MIWKSRRMKTQSIASPWHGSKEPSVGSTMAPTESAKSPASRFRRGGSKQCHTRRRSSTSRYPIRANDHPREHKIDPAKSDGWWSCQSHIGKDWKEEGTK